jgi:hypothetical protein
MVNFNARVCTKDLDLPHSELSPVIGDNIIGNAKPVHDFFDELTSLGTVMEVASFTSIHFVNLYIAMKMCVNPPLAFLKGRTKSSPHVEKGQVIGMVCS